MTDRFPFPDHAPERRRRGRIGTESMMSRFNLSAWAVAHPALMLFLIVMLGAAGLFSYRSLGRAEDPSFTIKARDRHRHVAGRHGRRDADPSRRSDREEASGAAVLRQGDHLQQAGIHGDAGRFQGQYAGPRRAAVVLSAAQENQRHQGRSSGRIDRAVGQRRVRRRRLQFFTCSRPTAPTTRR